MIPHTLEHRRFKQDPKSKAFYNDPYSFYRKLHKVSGPVFWEDYGFWCLCEFQSVYGALRDSRLARLPPAGHAAPEHPPHLQTFAEVERHSLLALEPPQHTRIRKCVNQAFVNRQVLQMRAEITELANSLVDTFEQLGKIDLLKHYATPLPVTVIAKLLGVPSSECESLLAWSHAMVRVYTLTQSVEEEHLANQASADFRDLLLKLIRHKRRSPCDDLLSQLAKPGDGALNDAEIVSVAVLLLNAGHEATVHQIGNAINLLLIHDLPQGWQINWSDSTDRTDAIVVEAMRFDAPLHLFTRYAQESFELHSGVTIEKGEQIALLLGAANRDPKRFSSADTFLPARDDGAYVSLGAGTHFCVGASLAKLEMEIALGTLFKRLPTLQLSQPAQYQNSYHFHGLSALEVYW